MSLVTAKYKLVISYIKDSENQCKLLTRHHSKLDSVLLLFMEVLLICLSQKERERETLLIFPITKNKHVLHVALRLPPFKSATV